MADLAKSVSSLCKITQTRDNHNGLAGLWAWIGNVSVDPIHCNYSIPCTHLGTLHSLLGLSLASMPNKMRTMLRKSVKGKSILSAINHKLTRKKLEIKMTVQQWREMPKVTRKESVDNMIFFQQRRNFHLQFLHNRITVPPNMQNLQPWETILMGMVKVKKVWKADYSRVFIPQELPKFDGTHHPSLEVTKTWNNREP